MLPKEKINKYYKNPNTRSFYKEYYNKCNPDKLLKNAKKGITLYEPLNLYKYTHPNSIDISIITKQSFMITNLNQYRKLNQKIKHSNNNKYENYELNLIYNKFITKYFINDNIIINKYIKEKFSIISYFIFIKAIIYNYIDTNCCIFFKLLNNNYKYIINFLNFNDYFYLNKNLLFIDNNELNIHLFLSEIFNKAILYCINKNFIKSI